MDVEIDYTSASLKNQDSLKKEAIYAVGKKALEKAENYAASVGGKLGKVIAVHDNDGESYSYARSSNKVYAMAMGADETALSSVADSVEISASVHLVVELLQ